MPADPYATLRAELAHFGPDPDPDVGVTLPVREVRALLEERDRLREALLKIAFPERHRIFDGAGNPARWSSTVAYLALGGRIEGGRRESSEPDLGGSSDAG